MGSFKERLARVPAFIRRHPLLVSAVAVAAVMAVAMLLFTPRFLTNDDRGISNLLQGSSSEGTPFSILTNFLLSWPLYQLYRITPGLDLNWFSVYQVLVLYASFVATGFVLLDAGEKKSGIWAWWILCLAVVPLLSVELSFSTTACVGCFAGMLLMVRALSRGGRLVAYLPGMALAFLAALLRYRCFLMTVPFGAVPALLVLFKDGLPPSFVALWAKAKKPAIMAAALVVLVWGASTGSKAIYNQAYPGLLSANSQRAHFNDYPQNDYELIADGLTELGITENGYSLLRNWVFADTEVYTNDVWEKLNALQPDPSPNLISGGYRLVTEYLPTLMGRPLYLVGMALAIALLFVPRRRAHWARWLAPALLAFGFHAVLYYFCLMGRLTLPVLNGVLFALIGALLYCLAQLPAPQAEEAALPRLAALCLLCVAPVLHLGSLRFVPAVNTAARDTVNELAAREDDIFFVSPTSNLSRATGVFERGTPRPNVVSLGGWSFISETTKKRYAALGITNPMRELDKENAYLLDNNGDYAERLLVYFMEHTGKSATLEWVGDIGGQALYKVVVTE